MATLNSWQHVVRWTCNLIICIYQECWEVPLHLHHQVQTIPGGDLPGELPEAVQDHLQENCSERDSAQVLHPGGEGLQWPGIRRVPHFIPSCTIKYVEKQPGKFVGDSRCEKLPVEVCGAGCAYEKGAEECHVKVITSVFPIPEEVCDLNPEKTSRFTTKLVPLLTP